MMNRILSQSRAAMAVRQSGSHTDKPAGLDYITEAPARRASRPVSAPRPVGREASIQDECEGMCGV